MGFTESELLAGSNIQQMKHSASSSGTNGGDSRDDVICMKIGFELYKKFGKSAISLSALNILDILDKTPPSLLQTSKRIHWCMDPKNPVIEDLQRASSCTS